MEFQKITDKAEMHYNGDVYDLTIQDEHSYNIDDIVVHNSGGGSLVCYALDIIKIDPLKYDLLFERFLNPERAHIPDIDADFGIYEGYKVFDYLNEKYGKDQCCNIVTYTRLKCKSLVKDICRALNIPVADVNAFAKKIDDEATIADIIKDKNLQYFYHKYPQFQEFLINYGIKLEGLPRQTGQHAAGICVAPFDVRKITPVVPAKENESDLQTNLSSFEKENMESLGIIKYDILKLKTLDIIKGTLDLINQTHNTNLTEDDIPLNDMQTWKALQDGKTLGVFQFEKPIGVKTLKQVKPDNIDELAACNSFIRPGTEGIHAFVKGKKNGGGIQYGDKRIDDILSNTFGAIVFQEQVMQLISALMDISFGKADLYRRALEKPNKSKNVQIVKDFSDNCVKIASDNGFNPKIAEKVKNAIIENSGYLFNKCIAGSEKIYCNSTQYNQPTIEEMYKIKNDPEFILTLPNTRRHLQKIYNKRGYGNALSMDENNVLIPNQIKNIEYVGIKDVYLVTTENKHTAKVTDNHKFPTPNGVFLLSELNVGDEIYTMTNFGNANSHCSISKIVSIEKQEPETVYNVQMANPYHNLLLQGGIVVSNSHAVAYSIISYQTAYLKEHYPLEFYATNINTCSEAEFHSYLQQAKQLNLDILPPNVNTSKQQCTVYNGKISIGFNVLKGIGTAMADTLIQHQPYANIESVITNSAFNKKCIEVLVNANAFDGIPLSNECKQTFTVPQLQKLIEYYNASSGRTQRYLVDSRKLPGHFLKQDGIVVEDNIIIMPENEIINLGLDPKEFEKTSRQGKGRFATFKPKTASKGLFGISNSSSEPLYNIYLQHKEDIDKQMENAVDRYLREMECYNFSFSEHPCMSTWERVNKFNEGKLFADLDEGKTCMFVGIIIDDVIQKTIKNKYKLYTFIINTPYETLEVSMWGDVYEALPVQPQKGLKCKVKGTKGYGAINVKSAGNVLIKPPTI